MKTSNRVKILNYCETVQCGINGIDHLENCLDIINALNQKDGSEYDLNFCAFNYGLEEYKGLCEIKSLSPTKYSPDDQIDQCKKCWKIALDGEQNEIYI